MTIKTLPNFKAVNSIRADLNAVNKTQDILASIGQNIVGQLLHGNKNHLENMVKALINKDKSLNRYAKDIMGYINSHEGLKVTYSAKNGTIKVKGKPSAVNCFASFLEVTEAEKAKKREKAKAAKEAAKANKGNEADIKAQAEKLSTMLKGYTLEQAKQIMLMAEQNLIASILEEQEKTAGNLELPSLEVPFKEAI